LRKVKKIFIIAASGTLVIALSIATFIYNSNHQEKEDDQITASNNQTIDITQINLTDDVKVQASYIGKSENLDEMLKNSDVIVKGIASKIADEKQMGIFFSFDIEKVIKGDYKKDDSIIVLTLKGDDQLTVGETYVLALENDSYYDEDTYHIMSGYQRLFSLEGENIKNKESKFNNDIDQIISNETDTDLPLLDKLCNEFTNRIKKDN
jgi:hypothetical protein